MTWCNTPCPSKVHHQDQAKTPHIKLCTIGLHTKSHVRYWCKSSGFGRYPSSGASILIGSSRVAIIIIEIKHTLQLTEKKGWIFPFLRKRKISTQCVRACERGVGHQLRGVHWSSFTLTLPVLVQAIVQFKLFHITNSKQQQQQQQPYTLAPLSVLASWASILSIR